MTAYADKSHCKGEIRLEEPEENFKYIKLEMIHKSKQVVLMNKSTRRWRSMTPNKDSGYQTSRMHTSEIKAISTMDT